MTDYAKIEKEVDAQAELIWDMAYNVWKFAELGLEEEQSSAYESCRSSKRNLPPE
jgi:metal-dependent amidase/aminoacylase/carboxypeptidase family protein